MIFPPGWDFKYFFRNVMWRKTMPLCSTFTDWTITSGTSNCIPTSWPSTLRYLKTRNLYFKILQQVFYFPLYTLYPIKAKQVLSDIPIPWANSSGLKKPQLLFSVQILCYLATDHSNRLSLAYFVWRFQSQYIRLGRTLWLAHSLFGCKIFDLLAERRQGPDPMWSLS